MTRTSSQIVSKTSSCLDKDKLSGFTELSGVSLEPGSPPLCVILLCVRNIKYRARGRAWFEASTRKLVYDDVMHFFIVMCTIIVFVRHE